MDPKMTKLELDIEIKKLAALLPTLDPTQRTFAASLLEARNPTDKQKYWIKRLANPVVVDDSKPKENVQNVSKMIEFISRGHEKLKWPKIVFRVYERTLVISLAGDRSKEPGSINVKDYNDGFWFGRIKKDGTWQPHLSVNQEVSDNILKSIRFFAENPAKVAAEYGHLTGHCCFCCRTLTDERSTSVGYGPICAENYDLPWGE